MERSEGEGARWAVRWAAGERGAVTPPACRHCLPRPPARPILTDIGERVCVGPVGLADLLGGARAGRVLVRWRAARGAAARREQGRPGPLPPPSPLPPPLNAAPGPSGLPTCLFVDGGRRARAGAAVAAAGRGREGRGRGGFFPGVRSRAARQPPPVRGRGAPRRGAARARPSDAPRSRKAPAATAGGLPARRRAARARPAPPARGARGPSCSPPRPLPPSRAPGRCSTSARTRRAQRSSP
jgi:hypothetical protein